MNYAWRVNETCVHSNSASEGPVQKLTALKYGTGNRKVYVSFPFNVEGVDSHKVVNG